MKFNFLLLLWLMALLVTACTGNPQGPSDINISIQVDGKLIDLEVSGDTTVQAAIEQAGIVLNPLDRTEPPNYMLLRDEDIIIVTHVKETFEIQENIIPFDRQTVRNESLAEGKTLLLQSGVNGLEQITYRTVYENDVEITRTVFKTTTLQEPKPEIVMVGVQAPFSAMTIPGTLAYLSAGNAWVMEGSTANRKPVVTTGDLDGRIFTLSNDGEWLLFTRKTLDVSSEDLNHLWAINVKEKNPNLLDTRISNVIHFADWAPGSSAKIYYSTVEPRSTAPGWQANNDLLTLTINTSGIIIDESEIIETNSGGVYGWWGVNYQWSPNGKVLAYSRPDSFGIVDFDNNELIPYMEVIPYQTNSEWAWVPGFGWGDDGNALYAVTHVSDLGLPSDEGSPLFDLNTYIPEYKSNITLVPKVGMFAYPCPSNLDSNNRYVVAYLQAIFPEQSITSNYRLMVMDRDGSNQRLLFPDVDSSGLEPQLIIWSPMSTDNSRSFIALTYQGNLWLIDPTTTNKQQITGDGSITRIAWK